MSRRSSLTGGFGYNAASPQPAPANNNNNNTSRPSSRGRTGSIPNGNQNTYSSSNNNNNNNNSYHNNNNNSSSAADEELYALQQQDPTELAYQVQREKSDRLYVERLFAVREEHHARARLYQQEVHERELLSTASTFAYTLRLEAERHRTEMEALRTVLEKQNGIGSLQRDVRVGMYALSSEQDALTQLATAAETHEAQMKQALTGEKIAWEGEKTQLLRRIGDLELAVQASRDGKSTMHQNDQQKTLQQQQQQQQQQHGMYSGSGADSFLFNNNASAAEQEKIALQAQRNAEEAWSRAKAAQDGLEKTPSHNNNSRFQNNTPPPPEFKLTPLPATVVSLDAVEKARQRTTALLDQLSGPQNQNQQQQGYAVPDQY